MKTLNLHCDYIKFKALKKALKTVDEIAGEQNLEGESKDCLVVMIAVEKSDNSKESVEKLVENVKDIASQVKAQNVVLYPYAHLSSELGKPSLAVEVMEKAKEALSENLSVISAPFGYYKEFELKVKGHPLSELSREIIVEGNEEVADLSDKDRERMLREISKSKLDTSKLAENDHRIIGKKMDLWSFNAVAPGMVFWHPKGLHIKNKLIEYWREIHRTAEYSEISTPQIMDKKLWEISGHWSKYGENNFKTDYERRDFLVKPMNCPGGMLVYKTSPKSYKDLPLRVGEIGTVHRVELSGVLSGLFRVIQINQDDAHIFCTEEQLENEISRIIDLIELIRKQFGLEFDHVELSTRPEKRIGDENLWDLAEKKLEEVLKNRKMKFVVNEGDGAFYGPKIDFHLKDSLNRTWQCATIQLDMALPERFDLEYTDEDGESQRPIMLHRVVYGKLFDAGFQVELDDRNITMGKKAREAQIEKYNYLVTIGNKEVEADKVAIKARDGDGKLELLELDDFISKLKEEIAARK
jgi:threonyl-tRNA synthetase